MEDIFKNIVKELDDEYTSVAADGEGSAEAAGIMDTGSYILNAALSGSIYGGVSDNRVTAWAGETGVGKTFFVLGIIKKFLDDNPNGATFLFDTESAITKDMLTQRGIDANRVIVSEPETIQKFRTNAIKILDNYVKTSENKRPPMLMVLDSLGQLSTSKEIEDTASGSETKDMTRAAQVKATFRVLNLKLAKAKVPFLVTNHVYDSVGSMFPTKKMGGGSGLYYTASQIIFLSTKKDKDGTEVVGNIIRCKMEKSRFTKQHKQVEVKLTYDKGLDRYYGLLDIAEKYGIIKKVSTRYEMPDGTKTFGKTIYNEPEKYFTPELLNQIDEACKKEFLYGQSEPEVSDNILNEE